MNDHDAIREQLWNLVYGLLEPDEVVALHARIKSDPAVARMYADTCLQAELVASAARIEQPAIELPAPGGKVAPARRPAAALAAESSFARGVNWFAGMGATALALLIAVMLWRPEIAPSPMATTAKLLEVRGDANWAQGLSRDIEIKTESSTGAPQSEEVEVTVTDRSGQVNFSRKLRTSAEGDARVEIPAGAVKPGNKLHLNLVDGTKLGEADHDGVMAAVPARPEEKSGHVALDRGWYQPGDTVRFRDVTLGRYSLQADPNNLVTYQVLGPDGKPVANAAGTVQAANGVAVAEVKLPADAAPGRYGLKVGGKAAASESEFEVRKTATAAAPAFGANALADTKEKLKEAQTTADKAIAKSGSGSAPGGFGGGEGGASLKRGAAGGMHGSAGRALRQQNAAGLEAELALAKKSEAKQLEPRSETAKDGKENEDVLAGGSRDSGEKGKQDFVGDHLSSSHAGQPRFNVPAEMLGKKLKILAETPRGEVVGSYDAVAEDERLLRRSGAAPGVSDPSGAPAVANAPAPDADRPLTESVAAGAKVNVRLPHEFSGLVRLKAVDESRRMVVAQEDRYVPPAQRLEIQFDDLATEYLAGEQVNLFLHVADEAGRPVAATLGVRVVDESVLAQPAEQDTLWAHWGLAVPQGEGLPYSQYGNSPTNEFFAHNAELGLGSALKDSRLQANDLNAKVQAADKSYALDFSKELAQESNGSLQAELAEVPAETVLASNRAALDAAAEQALAAKQAQRSVDRRFAGQVLIAGALLLTLLALTTYALRLAPKLEPKVWGPALAVAAASLLVGLSWVDPTASGRHAIATNELKHLPKEIDDNFAAKSVDAPRQHELSDKMNALAEQESAPAADAPAALPQLAGPSGGASEVREEQASGMGGVRNRSSADAQSKPSEKSGKRETEESSARKMPTEFFGDRKASEFDFNRGVSGLKQAKENATRDEERAKSIAPAIAGDAETKPKQVAPPTAPAPSPPAPPAPVSPTPEPKMQAQSPAAVRAPAPEEPAPQAVENVRRGLAADAIPAKGALEKVAPEKPRSAGKTAAADSLSPTLGDLEKSAADNGYVPLWEPLLQADEEGVVQLHFTLPLRAARYHVIVDAHAPGRIGSATRLFSVQLPEAKPEATPAPQPEK